MRTPGFSAEASLSKTSDYRSSSLRQATGGAQVQPQALTVHCYEGGHCEWRYVPDPGGISVHPITKT